MFCRDQKTINFILMIMIMLINKLQNIKMMILWLDNSSDKCMDV